MSDALILCGAVSQGAFTAGAVAEIFSPSTQLAIGLDVRRIVAASSGALNGAFVAASVREGSAFAGMEALEELWLDSGSVCDVFDVSFDALTRARGISTGRKLRSLLQRTIRPSVGSNRIELSVIITNLDGETDLVAGAPATTHARCSRFNGEAFNSEAKLSRLFDAVVASAAFPVVFEPVTLSLNARDVTCIDGGVCNDSPVGYALEGASDVDRIFVIAPFPRVQTRPRPASGVTLLTELAQVLVEERLFRDLKEADRVNQALLQLEQEFPLAGLRRRILDTIGWGDRRVVEIVEIRPPEDLEGDVFAGFFSKRLRQDYIQAGHEAARAALEKRRPL